MKSDISKCPICNSEAIVSRHLVRTRKTSVADIEKTIPAFVYTCFEHGWFALSDEVNKIVTNHPSSDVNLKLTKKVMEYYFPEEFWPADLRAIVDL